MPRPDRISPPPLAAWGLAGPAVPLAGGRGGVVRAGDVVLKPVGDVEEAEWSAEVLDRLGSCRVRVGRPVRSLDGRWVVDGFAAHRFVAGESTPAGHWADVLAAGRELHRALRGVPRPAFLDRRTGRWAIADRVAWGEAEIPFADALAGPAATFLRRLDATREPSQVVHGDLSGNTLLAPGLAPAVIDFSPYWRPCGYAEAVVVIDAMLYHGEGPAAAGLLAGPERGAHLARAWLFRAATLSQYLRIFGDPDGWRLVPRTRDVFAAIVRLV